MRGTRLAAVACVITVVSSSAFADEPYVDKPTGELSPSYLWDGGALPFIWAPLVGRVLLDKYAYEPRESPFAFDKFEGGASKADWEVPGYAITALGGVSALGMVAGGDGSRFYHVKGLAQSLSSGAMLTGLVKMAFGRHRPDWSEESNSPGSRRSFPSGHATQAFAIATYTALFLRGHVFNKYRGDKTLPWWEAAAYGGLALGATAFAGERVLHNRHHLTDVMVGGLLGTATSTLFYFYQEGRYDDHVESASRKQLSITPAQEGNGATVGFSFIW